MIVTSSFQVVRSAEGPVDDADWVALQEIPPEVELADASGFPTVHLKVAARDAVGGGVKGTCTVQVVAAGETVTSVVTRQVAYGTLIVCAGSSSLAVRLAGSSNSPAKMQVLLKGVT